MNHQILFDAEVNVPQDVEEQFHQVITAALEAEGVDVPCEVNVLFTDDEGIHQINLDMREVDDSYEYESLVYVAYMLNDCYDLTNA